MNLETLRKYCLSLPYVAENVQWGQNLVFRIETPSQQSSRKKGKASPARPKGKIFCVTNLEDEEAKVTFKCTPETFAELVEMPFINPAAYLARNHWVSLERWDALDDRALQFHVKESYNLVWEGLPKRTRDRLESGSSGKLAAKATGSRKPGRKK